MTQIFIAGTIFLITYAVIATERLHKTIAALAGAMLIILSGTLSQEQAFESVDWNVIFLLIGMMIIANTMRHTGVFTWLAVMAAKLGPWSAPASARHHVHTHGCGVGPARQRYDGRASRAGHHLLGGRPASFPDTNAIGRGFRLEYWRRSDVDRRSTKHNNRQRGPISTS